MMKNSKAPGMDLVTAEVPKEEEETKSHNGSYESVRNSWTQRISSSFEPIEKHC